MPTTPDPSLEPPEHPLARWDDDDATHPALVWWAQLDGRYLVEVTRTPPADSAVLRWCSTTQLGTRSSRPSSWT
jgi:hypothetical protein